MAVATPYVSKPVEKTPCISVQAGDGLPTCFVDIGRKPVSIHDREPLVKIARLVEWPRDGHLTVPVDVERRRRTTHRRQALREIPGEAKSRLNQNRQVSIDVAPELIRTDRRNLFMKILGLLELRWSDDVADLVDERVLTRRHCQRDRFHSDPSIGTPDDYRW